VTAAHILEQWDSIVEGAKKARHREAERQRIEADATLTPKERAKQLQSLGKPQKDETDRGAINWGNFPGHTELVRSEILTSVDLGIGKLEPFDPSWVSEYPTFKDPAKGFEPGVSLCKFGYPFVNFGVGYDVAADAFVLPTEALQPPPFPIEGLFARVSPAAIEPNAPVVPFPQLFVETSSPGLRGQSGGPTFDAEGVIWALQCKTAHLPLGFSNKIPEQYLHVGLGVHPTTIFGMLDTLGVKYAKTSY
jgi:hypothetical protein